MQGSSDEKKTEVQLTDKEIVCRDLLKELRRFEQGFDEACREKLTGWLRLNIQFEGTGKPSNVQVMYDWKKKLLDYSNSDCVN